MKKISFLIIALPFLAYQPDKTNYSSEFSVSWTGQGKNKPVIIWQPSQQTDTGKDFSEAATCNGIVEAAMKTKPKLKEFKVWSLGRMDVHHADSGSNTKIEHTTAVINGKISGYAHELQQS